MGREVQGKLVVGIECLSRGCAKTTGVRVIHGDDFLIPEHCESCGADFANHEVLSKTYQIILNSMAKVFDKMRERDHHESTS